MWVKLVDDIAGVGMYDEDEKNMLIIESFMDAANSIQLNKNKPHLVILRLVEGTKRTIKRQKSKLFTQYRTELPYDKGFFVEIDGGYASPEEIYLQKESIEQIAKKLGITKSFGETDNIDIAEVIVSMIIADESIADYVRAQLGDVDDKTFKRECNRIRKAKERILKRMNIRASR